MSDPWTFEQLGGDRKVLTLGDADAPHGRERHGAIVTDGVDLRESENYYSGNNVPTRHLFGHKSPPWKLHGRFSDRTSLQKGYAKLRREYLKGFVADMQEVEATWGDQLHVLGLLTKLELGIESKGECTWAFELLINEDLRLSASASKEVKPFKPLQDTIVGMEFLLMELSGWKKPKFQLEGSILDVISGYVDALTAPFVALSSMAREIQSFERALLGDITRFRARINEARNAVIILTDTVSEFTVGVAVQSQRAQDEFSFTGLQATTEANMNTMLRQLVDLDKEARAAQRGKTKGLYAAVANDTWESIATRAYGSASRADDIRSANGVDAGTKPEAGGLYIIPV